MRAIGPLKTAWRAGFQMGSYQAILHLQSLQSRIIRVGNESSRYYADQANHRWALPMRQLLITAFEDAVAQFKAEVALMPLTRWNESVFRFKYSRAVATREPNITQFVECTRIDLVLHHDSERAFVEFKFYTHSAAYDVLCGIKTGMKGLPALPTVGSLRIA